MGTLEAIPVVLGALTRSTLQALTSQFCPSPALWPWACFYLTSVLLVRFHSNFNFIWWWRTHDLFTSCLYNKLPETGKLINSRDFFLIVLEAEKSRSRPTFWLCAILTWWKRGDTCPCPLKPFHKVLVPFRRALHSWLSHLLKALFLNLSCWWSHFSLQIWGEGAHSDHSKFKWTITCMRST